MNNLLENKNMTERERLLKVMESENMSAKQFAIEVGIQPGTISNIMGGRNNPSLDVMQRVLNRFRSINSDWLILGIGQMYRMNGEVPAGALFDIRPDDTPNYDSVETPSPLEQTVVKTKLEDEKKPQVCTKEIEKIIVFYTDGTFEER